MVMFLLGGLSVLIVQAIGIGVKIARAPTNGAKKSKQVAHWVIGLISNG